MTDKRYSRMCKKEYHRRCWGRCRQGEILVRCDCICHGEPLKGYPGDYIHMPEGLRLYFEVHQGEYLRIAHLLHESTSTLKYWQSGKRRMPPWQLARIVACLELIPMSKSANGKGLQ